MADTLLPLRDVAELLNPYVTHQQLREWARRRETTGFPEPAEVLGKYEVYDLDQVKHWYELWLKINARLGRGKKLNDERKER